MAEDTQRFSDGTSYEQFMGRWTRAIGTIFLDWLAPPTDARWLDIGCGTGVFTDLIVSTCSPATVVAIDPSEPQSKLRARKQSRNEWIFGLRTRRTCRSRIARST